jgi:hypothetical protein
MKYVFSCMIRNKISVYGKWVLVVLILSIFVYFIYYEVIVYTNVHLGSAKDRHIFILPPIER